MVRIDIAHKGYGKRGELTEAKCMGISHVAGAPIPGICRKLIERHPELALETVEVYRDNKLSLTCLNVQAIAGISIRENENGLHIVKYQPFDFSELDAA